jgi:Domain of unknown function (DUF4383)
MSSLQSPRMDGRSPARLYATAVGAGLVVIGIVGFFYSASFGSPGEVKDAFGVFAVNGWDNVLHILTGVLGLLAADYASRRYSLWLGAFYVGLALWGFTIGDEAILGFLPVNAGDNLLHLVLGALGVLAALGTPAANKEKKGSPATA